MFPSETMIKKKKKETLIVLTASEIKTEKMKKKHFDIIKICCLNISK